jgi:membrane-bound serine protease (ClpP class)
MNDLIATLQNPNVAFLLLVVGGLALATELVHPNLITGILGVAALVLAAIGLAGLPLNWPGLLLLVLGFVLLVAETQVTSYGLLTLAGAICVGLGAYLLYGSPGPGEEPVQVDPAVLVITTGAFMLAGLGLAFVAARARRMPAPREQLGTPPAAGTGGIVEAPLGPIGTVQLGGETWTARTPDERLLPRGTAVRLVAIDGLTAIVQPDHPDDPASPPASPVPITDPSAASPAADRT